MRYDKGKNTVHLEKGELHYNAFAFSMNGNTALAVQSTGPVP
jgi:hypothetical protein